MRFIVYDPRTGQIDGVFELEQASLFPEWPGLTTRLYNSGTDEEWAQLLANPDEYIVSEVGGFHLEKIQNKLKSNEEPSI